MSLDLEREILSSNNLVMIGDFNAKIGNDNTGYEEVMGPHGFGNKNREGEKMLEWCERNSIQIGNSWFKKRRNQQVTRYGYGETIPESVIDFI